MNIDKRVKVKAKEENGDWFLGLSLVFGIIGFGFLLFNNFPWAFVFASVWALLAYIADKLADISQKIN